MKKILTLITLSFLASFIANAQKADGVLKGSLKDSTGNQPVMGAVVSILKATDSSLVTFTLTNKTGVFEIKGLETGNYKALISFKNYLTINRPFVVSAENKQIDFGEIELEPDYKALGEVVVKNILPIVIKDDTIQFNDDWQYIFYNYFA